MPLLTQSAFARLVGVSRSAVSQAVQAGVLTPVPGPGQRMLLDEANSTKAWEEFADANARERGEGNQRSGKREAWVDVKTQTERIKAELLAIELAELKGELLRKDAIEKELSPLLRNARDAVLSSATNLAVIARSAKDLGEAARLIEAALLVAMRHLVAKPKGEAS
jgi:transcriptional regulator with XRE-family HTH domain